LAQTGLAIVGLFAPNCKTALGISGTVGVWPRVINLRQCGRGKRKSRVLEQMPERRQLEQSIADLEAQRAALGDAVVDAALAPLQEALAQLEGDEPAAMPESSAERRVVTVLFCDVTGSTALAEQMDPEAWTGIMNTVFELLSEPVARYGGIVARLMGDAILHPGEYRTISRKTTGRERPGI
jgi:hypothetical protein